MSWTSCSKSRSFVGGSSWDRVSYLLACGKPVTTTYQKIGVDDAPERVVSFDEIIKEAACLLQLGEVLSLDMAKDAVEDLRWEMCEVRRHCDVID